MKTLVSIFTFFVFTAVAQAESSFYIRPHVGVGVNSQQGTSMILGLDLGYNVDENWRAGLTGHYSSGAHPERDRETGGGVFGSYALDLAENFVGHIREDLEYLDVRNPYDPLPTTGPKYETEMGIASTTSVGMTINFAQSLALTIGYRFVLGLTNSDLGDGRSGPTLGVMIGI